MKKPYEKTPVSGCLFTGIAYPGVHFYPELFRRLSGKENAKKIRLSGRKKGEGKPEGKKYFSYRPPLDRLREAFYSIFSRSLADRENTMIKYFLPFILVLPACSFLLYGFDPPVLKLPYNMRIAVYVGYTEDGIILKFGAPDRVYETDGTKYLTYVEAENRWTTGPFSEYYAGKPPRYVIYRCETTFAVKNGKVTHASGRGNLCYDIEVEAPQESKE